VEPGWGACGWVRLWPRLNVIILHGSISPSIRSMPVVVSRGVDGDYTFASLATTPHAWWMVHAHTREHVLTPRSRHLFMFVWLEMTRRKRVWCDHYLFDIWIRESLVARANSTLGLVPPCSDSTLGDWKCWSRPRKQNCRVLMIWDLITQPFDLCFQLHVQTSAVLSRGGKNQTSLY
jgi:hypothetical protein